MTTLARKTALALGLLFLGLVALSLVGCEKDPAGQDGASGRLDSGSIQGDSGASTATGGTAGAGGGSGIATGGQTGYWCSAGGGAPGTADGSGTSGAVAVPLTCYPYAYGSFYCSPHLCGCSYNPETGCLCADDKVSPCKPVDPNCTASTAGGTANLGLGTVNPNKNVSCYCDINSYWWCSQ